MSTTMHVCEATRVETETIERRGKTLSKGVWIIQGYCEESESNIYLTKSEVDLMIQTLQAIRGELQ